MNLHIITGFLLCFCFVASISISESASASIDSKLRFRRQDEDSGADGTSEATETSTGAAENADVEESTSSGNGEADEDNAAGADTTAAAAADGDDNDNAETTAASGGEGDSGDAETTAAAGGEGDSETTAAAGSEGDSADAETTAAAGGDDDNAGAETTAAAEGDGDSANAETTAAAAEGEDDNGGAETTAATGDEGSADAETTAAADGDEAETTAAAGGDDDAETTAAASGDDAETTAAAEGDDAETTAAASGDDAETTAAAEGDDAETTAAADGESDAETTAGSSDASSDAEETTASGGDETTGADTTAESAGEESTSAASDEATSEANPASDTDDTTNASDDDGETSQKPDDSGLDDATTEGSDEGSETTTAEGGDGGDGTEDATTEASGQGDSDQPQPVDPGRGQQVELRVVVSPEVLNVRRGQTVELTCTVYGGNEQTSIYWIQEEPERRYALTDPAGPNDKQVSGSQVSLVSRITLDDPNKIGKYTCLAQDASGNSASAILTMQEQHGGGGYQPRPVYPEYEPRPTQPPYSSSGSLRIVAPEMRDGDYVEIQCEGAAPEDEGRIEWYFNGRVLQDENPLYPRGKTLYIRPISRGYLGNYRCSIPSSGYTDANSVLTFGGYVPVPTAPPTQAPPVYGRCGIDEATCRNGRCIPRSYVCNGNDDCGDGSDETCSPHGGSGSDVCQPNEISCTNPGRGRKCVQKFWMCDGDRDCDDGSDEEQRYCDLLPRQRYCQKNEFQCAGSNNTQSRPVCIPRSFQCDGYNDCPDRSDEIGCVKPTIISPPQRQIEITAGSTLTIQCTARGSPAPYINWRLNWGHVCRDGSDNGRCQMAQALDPNDPTVVIGTLTVSNVNVNDGGAYSCEVLNNQGFIFAVPDAIVNVIIGIRTTTPVPCNCNGHSTSCTPDGRCLNCQHYTAGTYCEYCITGYQGDARRGTPYDCQPIPAPPPSYCDEQGTYTQRGDRCICKYNVEGERCNQCKRSHFYLNPTTPNGCLPCFCSGVSSDCSSSDWKRKSISLPLDNWNAVPKNFATDRYEAGSNIQRRAGGRELSLDQSSLRRPASEVLYWKAPKEVLGDFVTLYDGTIDILFVNDGENRPTGNDEYIWLRGNNIDLVHKIPQNQQLQANTNVTYSVPCNERTFTRKDGTYIDRENILMALSDLDTFLIKINPLGGKRNAVLREVTLNPATRDGYGQAALTVEACRCPANYTGTSCEKCAEGYGRPHPLVGIYLGQCWSCRSLCNDRSDQCDRDTGRCLQCEGNFEGEKCERCRSGYTLDGSGNQCVQDGYNPYPSEPVQPSFDPSSRGPYYVNDQPYDPRNQAPLNIALNGGESEQRVQIQLNAPTRSVVWGRTDGSPLPANVYQDGNALVFRNPSAEQSGHYICAITFPDGYTMYINVHLDYRPAPVVPAGPSYPLASFNPPSPLQLQEGANQLVQVQSGLNVVRWTREGGQSLPNGIYQNNYGLQITNARGDYSGVYNLYLQANDGSSYTVPYEIVVKVAEKPASGAGAPKVTIQPRTINLKEGQRMIVQYSVASQDPINVAWYKWTDQGYQPIPSLFTVEENRLVLNRATPEAAGTYQVVVRNTHGEDRQELKINVEPRRGRGRGQAAAPQVRFQEEQYEVGNNAVDIVPSVTGASGATFTWSKDGSTSLPQGVVALEDGTLRINAASSAVEGRYTLDVVNAYGRGSSNIYIRWVGQDVEEEQDDGQDRSQVYAIPSFEAHDPQSHYVGRDIHLQCSIQTNVPRPYEYTYSKDGYPLDSNVEVHPNGLLIIRNAQTSDSGTYRCDINLPSSPATGQVYYTYELQVNGGAGAGGHDQGHHSGSDSHHQQQQQQQQQQEQYEEYVEASVHPGEAVISRGQTATFTCEVKGAQQYTVTWGKYAYDTSLPDYARQNGNTVILAPGADSQAEEMYLQCQVDVPGRAQPYHAYARVSVVEGNESSKMKKKRRS